MHLFFDTVWKLHIGEIPKKPKSKEYLKNMSEAIEKTAEWMVYVEAIAAIKQNALTVGNPSIIDAYLLANKIGAWVKDEFYFWPGGYEPKEIYRTSHSSIQTVAILTLPEKKNKS